MVSFDKLDSFDDESDNNMSDSGYAGTCAFPFRFDEYVGTVGESIGRVSGVGSGIFFLTGIDSISDIFLLVVFVPKGFKSKCGRLVEIFSAQNLDFTS